MKKEFLKSRLTALMFIMLMFVMAGSALTSCDGGDSGEFIDPPVTGWVRTVSESYQAAVGETITVTAGFSSDKVRNLEYKWTSSDEKVATVTMNGNKSASVKGVAEGSAILKIVCTTDATITAQCTVTVKESGYVPPAATVRILAIGNSFSQDAVEQYLYELAAAEGIKTIIGNLYIGGCTLATHLSNANSDAAAYEYRKIVNGSKSNQGSVKMSAALAEEPWDYISLQQASDYSGVYSTFEASLPALVNYVKARATNENMWLMLHQTWAYARNSTHSAFPTYGKDQMTMYNAIVDAYKRAATLSGINIVIPAGTAIQNGRTSYLGDSFNIDGYHLEVNYGRYTAACTWFEKIFGKDVTQNTYKPASVSDYNAEIARTAAHYAVQKPNQVTDMVDYKKNKDQEDLPYGFYIDFGSSLSPSPWNNVNSISSTTPIALTDSEGGASSVTIAVTKAFGGINTEGPGSTTTSLKMPSSASSDSFWGNTGAAFGGVVTGETQLTVASLDKTKQYVFTFFSGRNASDNRETKFTVTGTASDVQYLNAAGNTTKTAVTSALAPDSNGKITITLTSGPNNTNTNGFFYINAMSIAPALQP